MRSASPLRCAALLAAGALAVHELRYVIGYGEAAGATLVSHGHAYLTLTALGVVALLVIAGAQFLARLAAAGGDASVRAAAEAPDEERARLLRLWLVASAVLLCTYVAQETLEGLLAPGHPGGLAGVFGHGGWIVLGLAPAIGGLVALLLRGAQRAIERLATRRGGRRPSRRLTVQRPVQPERGDVRSVLLARNLAGRAPPALAVSRP